MARPRAFLRVLFSALLPLVLLAPALGELGGGRERLCSCGMKQASCFCERIAGSGRSGSHCAGSCSLRPQGRSGPPPRPGLAHDVLGLFTRLDFAVAPDRTRAPLAPPFPFPASPAHPPELPPPRSSSRPA